jgi:Xaa-Pro aminopeptidase
MLEIFTKEEYQTRVNQTVEAMEAQGVQALLAFANKVMPGHVRYLSGYETRHGIHDWCFLILLPSRPSTLLTNVTWENHKEMTWVSDIVITGLDKVGQAIADRLPKDIRSIGIAGYNHLPTPVYRTLASRFPSASIADASDLLLEVRRVKSLAEIGVLRRCAEITDAGGEAFLSASQEGRSERDILVEVEGALKRNGSDEVSFATQVGRGPRTALICPYPTDEVLKSGDLVQLDCGATYLGYRGDISRVAVVGKPSSRQRLLLDVVVEMYERVCEALKPGVLAADIARLGVKTAESFGLKDFLYRSPAHPFEFMGHGIGCSYFELPDLSVNSKTEILENMIIVVEPILCEPGVGGVKIEDAGLVTQSGFERFSTCRTKTWID